MRTFSIDGSIQMKSYLSGSPELHLALNDDLAIASAGKGGYGMVELDNVNFHECVQLDKFDSERMLVLEPPHGEFVLMNFHIGSLRSDTQIPFRITPIMTAVTEYKQELRLQVRVGARPLCALEGTPRLCLPSLICGPHYAFYALGIARLAPPAPVSRGDAHAMS